MGNNWGIRLYLNGLTNEEANKLYKAIMSAVKKAGDKEENKHYNYYCECTSGIRVPNKRPAIAKPLQAFTTNNSEIVTSDMKKLFDMAGK
jgi:hypothetical protein